SASSPSCARPRPPTAPTAWPWSASSPATARPPPATSSAPTAPPGSSAPPPPLAVAGALPSPRPAAARDFVRAYGATWPVGLDPAATTAGRWGAVGLPHTYFVPPDGTLASHQLGELTRPALDRQLALILEP